MTQEEKELPDALVIPPREGVRIFINNHGAVSIQNSEMDSIVVVEIGDIPAVVAALNRCYRFMQGEIGSEELAVK